MYRLVNRAFDLFNKISPVIIQMPSQRSFGNSAKGVFYGLICALKEGEKVLFLDRQGELSADLFVLTHPVNDPFGAARIRARGARGMYTGYLTLSTVPELFGG
jgi:hypothetical protein